MYTDVSCLSAIHAMNKKKRRDPLVSPFVSFSLRRPHVVHGLLLRLSSLVSKSRHQLLPISASCPTVDCSHWLHHPHSTTSGCGERAATGTQKANKHGLLVPCSLGPNIMQRSKLVLACSHGLKVDTELLWACARRRPISNRYPPSCSCHTV